MARNLNDLPYFGTEIEDCHAPPARLLRLPDAVTEADIRAIAKALVKRARDGEVPAVRELLDRLLGRPGDVQELSAPTEIRVITGVSEREYHEEAAAALVTGVRSVRSLGDGGRS